MKIEDSTKQPAQNEDDQRMIRLQEGEAAAFSEIACIWQGQLFGFFVRNTRDEHLSEDLVQETLLKLYRSRCGYIPQGSFRGFLFKIARNLLVDHIRRTTSDVLISSVRGGSVGHDGQEFDLGQMLLENPATPLELASEHEISMAVQELLIGLPDEQRETFTLHHYRSLTLLEVADAMHVSLSTAKSRLRMVKEKLRNLLVSRGFGNEMTRESESLCLCNDDRKTWDIGQSGSGSTAFMESSPLS